MYRMVEKKNHDAVHAMFNTRGNAEHHLRVTVHNYVKHSLFKDKTLTADSFEIVDEDGRKVGYSYAEGA